MSNVELVAKAIKTAVATTVVVGVAGPVSAQVINGENQIDASNNNLSKLGVGVRGDGLSRTSEKINADSESQSEEAEYELSAPRAILLERQEEINVFSGYEKQLVNPTIRYNESGRQFEAIFSKVNEDFIVTQSGQSYFAEGEVVTSILEGTSEFSLKVGAQLGEMEHLWGMDGDRQRTYEEIADSGKLVVAVEENNTVKVALEVLEGTSDGEIILPPESIISYEPNGEVDDYIAAIVIPGVHGKTVYGALGVETAEWLETNFGVRANPDFTIFYRADFDTDLPIALSFKNDEGDKYGLVLAGLANIPTPPPTPEPYKRAEFARPVQADSLEVAGVRDLSNFMGSPEEIYNGTALGMISYEELGFSAPKEGESAFELAGELNSEDSEETVEYEVPNIFNQNQSFRINAYQIKLRVPTIHGDVVVSLRARSRVVLIEGNSQTEILSNSGDLSFTDLPNRSTRTLTGDEALDEIQMYRDTGATFIGVSLVLPHSRSSLENLAQQRFGVSCSEAPICAYYVSDQSSSTNATNLFDIVRGVSQIDTTNKQFVNNLDVSGIILR